MASVQHYLDALPSERRAMVDALHSLIVEAFPDVRVDMQYKMPTYHYGEGWIAVASKKHYVSLYTCGYHHIEEFKRRHPKIKTGKGCINLKPTEPLPQADLQAVVQHAFEHPKPD